MSNTIIYIGAVCLMATDEADGISHMHSHVGAELKPDGVQKKCRTGHVGLNHYIATCDCAEPITAGGRTAVPQQQVRWQDARTMHVAAASHLHDMAILRTP